MEFITFGLKKDDQTEDSPEILGGKGAGLKWMVQNGVPVPPGFVIPTTAWALWNKGPKTTMKAIAKELPKYMAMLKEHFGYMPLVGVRSGSRVSCPGMMDTVLNVGLDANSMEFWKTKLGDVCFANSFHRLVTMYGSVVKGIKREELESSLMAALHEYQRQTGEEKFPDAQQQLLEAIEAVFKSWDNERAKVYRKLNDIPREWGTAVTVQAMVFGNLNDASGSGVLFTRNPDTGACKVIGEFLQNAQGEDVVAGIRTPMDLDHMSLWNKPVYEELIQTVTKLEFLRKDAQDVEFTIQDGKLYILQIRNAKRSATAVIRIAFDMAEEKLIDKKEAVKRVTLKHFDLAQLAHLDPKFSKPEAFRGIPACSGVVMGRPVFSSEDAIDCKEPCILIAQETKPDDIAGMYAAVGIVTMTGGATSHAAVVARGMNRACICGVGASLETFKETDVVAIDGATGRIWLEQVPIVSGEQNGLLHQFSKLVFEILDAIPVILEVPKDNMKQALLYLGDKILHTKEAADLVVSTSWKVEKLYLDLVPLKGGPEEEYMSICAGYDPAQKVIDRLEGVPQLMVAKLAEKLVVLGGVKTKKFKILGTATDLRALVLSEGELAIDANADMSDPVVQKVMEWKQKEGSVSMVSIGQYVKGTKSILSMQQALQILNQEE